VKLTPASLRSQVRAREWTGPTAGLLEGYQQANLVALPESDAFEFLPNPAFVLGARLTPLTGAEVQVK
jgi:uncharacterized protein YcsI (UPF0317 family)